MKKKKFEEKIVGIATSADTMTAVENVSVKKWHKAMHGGYKCWLQMYQENVTMRPALENLIGKWHWTRGKFSVVSPCIATMNKYELYGGEKIYRFDTVKEAKKFAETLK